MKLIDTAKKKRINAILYFCKNTGGCLRTSYISYYIF